MLSIGFDGKLLVLLGDKMVKNVALASLETQLFDRCTNLIQCQKMNGAGFGHYIFFNHQTSHVVGTIEKRQLPNL